MKTETKRWHSVERIITNAAGKDYNDGGGGRIIIMAAGKDNNDGVGKGMLRLITCAARLCTGQRVAG